MATYILLHGGRKSGTVWHKIVPLLTQHKHAVFCPTLTDAKYSTLANHVEEVCRILLKNNLTDVILVGHSYGGIVITGVANACADRLKHLVYVDSAYPRQEMSLVDLINSPMASPSSHFDIPTYQPYITPMQFDEKRLAAIAKTYIYCSNSEFKDATKQAFDYINQLPPQHHWQAIQFETTHNPMLTLPQRLTDVLIQLS